LQESMKNKMNPMPVYFIIAVILIKGAEEAGIAYIFRSFKQDCNSLTFRPATEADLTSDAQVRK